LLNPPKEPDHINQRLVQNQPHCLIEVKGSVYQSENKKETPFVLLGNDIEHYEIYQPHHILGQNLEKSLIVTTRILTAY